MGKRERRIFTEDFKKEAVRLTETSGRTIGQANRAEPLLVVVRVRAPRQLEELLRLILRADRDDQPAADLEL